MGAELRGRQSIIPQFEELCGPTLPATKSTQSQGRLHPNVSSDVHAPCLSVQGPGPQSLRTKPLSHNATCDPRCTTALSKVFALTVSNVIKRSSKTGNQQSFFTKSIENSRPSLTRNQHPAMAPKTSRAAQDDTKSETPNPKERNGTTNAQQINGKMRRVASSAGTNAREATNGASGPVAPPATASASTATAPGQEPNVPGLQWPAFDRDVLHAYRRAYRLSTPTAFTSDYHQWVLTQAGSIGVYSPTIARRKELRRQTKDQLTNTVRKHFNGLGVQENDIIVDFLHKVRNQAVTKGRPRRTEYISPETER
ncbi:hypothetical protein B0T14DRAFT_512207 [Immersiella caudata]|uniref:Histone deacetylase complex subunit SAP30 Sin3 binding domain-containing protein n=1 Tax=Immersiella caudata TaxID=314043 RepID=A0AA40C6E1_9PEZI|nr:hypothetical protein B0T14DRAFT_512207 [Immersiella caudata]